MTYSGWTLERENQLKVLWLRGDTVTQIAKQIGGVTRNAVIGKRIRMGLPDRGMPARTYRKGAASAPVNPTRPKPKAPVVAYIPKSNGPKRGPNSVRFIDRRANQCPMFCEGEEGAQGFVCGDAAEAGSWCRKCRALVFDFRAKAAA